MQDTEIQIEQLRSEKYSCSQSTLLGIARSFGKGMPSENMLKAMSTAFRGGIGRTFDEGTCGALTGAIIALGLIYADDENKAANQAKEVYSGFKKHFGTVCCGHITNEHGKKRCTECCRVAGKLVEELVNRDLQPSNKVDG